MPLPIVLEGDEVKPDNTIRKIVDGAMGIPLILDTAPTTSNAILPEGRWGIYSGSLYITLSGTTYKWTLTTV